MPARPKVTRKQALEELALRRGLIKAHKVFNLEDYLFDKQLAFVRDTSPFKEATTTRRAGKSVSCVADLTHTALMDQGVICLYITLSRKNAKRLIWPEFKKLNKLFELGGDVNESDLSIAFPNGSIVYILGANDRTAIEDFRGLALKKVYIDEAQSFPSYIQELIDDVLGPALMDYNGQLILIGTPGPIPNGYFYELTKNPNWSHHYWSFFDNPKLPFLSKGLTHQDMLNRELTRRGVKAVDPSIQREWYGKWVVDKNSLVYHYNQEVNDYGNLPDERYTWTYLLGVDLGFEDCDALAVIAYSSDSPCTYLVEERVTRHQDLTALCSQIDELTKKYKLAKIVVDTGGLGKKITEEISKRWAIPMVAAEKTRKMEYIELMNTDLRTGRFKIKATSHFAQDAMKVEWDWDHTTPDRKVISKRFHSDICEAVLYVWRESYGYTFHAKPEEFVFGTPEWSNDQAEKMFNAEIEHFQKLKEHTDSFIPEELERDDTHIQKLDRPPLRYQYRFNRKKQTPED